MLHYVHWLQMGHLLRGSVGCSNLHRHHPSDPGWSTSIKWLFCSLPRHRSYTQRLTQTGVEESHCYRLWGKTALVPMCHFRGILTLADLQIGSKHSLWLLSCISKTNLNFLLILSLWPWEQISQPLDKKKTSSVLWGDTTGRKRSSP